MAGLWSRHLNEYPFMENEKNRGAALIVQNFEIVTDKTDFSDEELFDILSQQISDMLERKPEYLFSLMYRMDVLENKITAVLHPMAKDLPHVGLTKLVLERQNKRNKTREMYRQKPIDDLEKGLEY
ncbi:MAG: hypothetical protein ACI85O_001193 [Saprospiraceae bacterium]|jgi:hypothetical protein